ncbi:unnamed protein product [Owenia fusiformis]|uniref:Chitin-binding type-2 domain-containing protein n=1 Tax=Owenia fusiformis TaxID=6347 RepID=A0A8S4NW50_OWEFU|nr:unnamed protein product [Owenia fusiformis]
MNEVLFMSFQLKFQLSDPLSSDCRRLQFKKTDKMLFICMLIVAIAYAQENALDNGFEYDTKTGLYYRMLEDAEKDRCTSGYFETSTSNYVNYDCCHYLQCDVNTVNATHVYVRACEEPMVWNIDKCSCDFRRHVRSCRNTPSECYEIVEPPPSCPAVDELPPSECCRDGVFYIPDETLKSFRLSRDAKSAEPIECPFEQTFDLEECACTGDVPLWRGDCVYFNFDGNYKDNLQATWMFPGSVEFNPIDPPIADFQRDESLGPLVLAGRFVNETPAAIPYFSKVLLGYDVTIMAWFYTRYVSGNLWDNGDSTVRGEGSTLFFTLDLDEDRKRKRQADNEVEVSDEAYRVSKALRYRLRGKACAFGGCASYDSAKVIEIGDRQRGQNGQSDEPESQPMWVHLAMKMTGFKVYLYVNGALVGSGDAGIDPIYGTERPLYVGRRYTGLMDDLIVCRFAWTDDEVLEFYQNRIIPPTPTYHL